MARLSGSGFAGKKSKVGFMMRDTSLAALNSFKEQNQDIVRSPGEAIDYCCDLFLGVDGATAAVACDLLCAGAANIEASSADATLSQFERQQALLKAKGLEKIAEHFRRLASPDELAENKVPVCRIDLMGGDYVLVPDDGSWIVLDEEAARKSSHVGAVSVSGGKGEGIPFALFFSDEAISAMNEEKRDELIGEIAHDYPEITSIQDEEVEAAYDSQGNMVNAAEWQASPRVGFFEVLDNRFYKSRAEAPGKALVYRAN